MLKDHIETIYEGNRPMRVPSVKNLLATFAIEPEEARLIRNLAHSADDRETLGNLLTRFCPETEAYRLRCYNEPLSSGMWRRTMVLHAIDRILGTHGVEALGKGQGPTYAPPYEYLNAGDSYAATLIYKRETDNLYVGCWVTVAERLPRGED